MRKTDNNKMETALFQIHSLATMLKGKAMENDEPSENNKTSNELLSLSQVIVEKAEFCLEVIEGS